MDHHDHVALLRPGLTGLGGVWADLGSGHGAFTLALAELLGPRGIIYSVDSDGRRLGVGMREVQRQFPGLNLIPMQADFTQPLDLPPLDGVVMANSLHFIANKLPVVRLVRGLLKVGASFLLVEYNVDRGNHWVPYPVSFRTWQRLAVEAGFRTTILMGTQPSHFLREIYAARST